MAIEKKQIVQKALEILNRDGLEGVTLRRLAGELKIKAASIYWHIPNKSDLLDEMANAILEKRFDGLDFQDDTRAWDEWLDTLAHELRAAMLAYQDGARVVAGTHPALGQMSLKLWELSTRILHKAGFLYGKAATVTFTVINFTFGSVIEEQSSRLPQAGPKVQRTELPPVLKTALEEWDKEDNDKRFDASVRMIINGVRLELNTLNSKDN
ncbi:MAG: TetR/AcrR family transcriptional regulator C-terminal domain-containing protein [Anaerolineae bacterium]|nr:TetR/AcrR family transcriptional regulator C-terminal domain-containing protein [Anaerolineae bacterium]